MCGCVCVCVCVCLCTRAHALAFQLLSDIPAQYSAAGFAVCRISEGATVDISMSKTSDAITVAAE